MVRQTKILPSCPLALHRTVVDQTLDSRSPRMIRLIVEAYLIRSLREILCIGKQAQKVVTRVRGFEEKKTENAEFDDQR